MLIQLKLQNSVKVLAIIMLKQYVPQTPSVPIWRCDIFWDVTGYKAGPLSQLSTGQRSSADGREQQVFKPHCFSLFLLYQHTAVFFYYEYITYDHSTPYTPLDKRAMENTDEDTTTDDWTLEQPLAQTRTTAIVEVKGAINVVLTPLVAESLDR